MKYSYILGAFKTRHILSSIQVKFKDNTNKNLLSFDKASSEVHYGSLYDQTYGLICRSCLDEEVDESIQHLLHDFPAQRGHNKTFEFYQKYE